MYNRIMETTETTTTIGELLLMEILPPDLRKYGKPIDKKELNNILAEVGLKYPGRYGTIVKELKDLGDHYATQFGSSFSLADFKPKDISAITNKYDSALAKLQHLPEGVVKDNKMRAINTQIENEINDKVKDDIASGNNRFLLWGRTGAKGGASNFRQILYASGNQTDVKKEVFPHMSKRSLSEGLSPSDFFITSTGARTGVVSTFNSVQQPGAHAKETYATVNEEMVSMIDCGTHDGLVYDIHNPSALDRVLAEDQHGHKRNEIVTSILMHSLEQNGAKSIKVRSPSRCVATRGVCSMCSGLLEDGTFAPIGYIIGLTSAQAAAEPLTQFALDAKHNGGVVGKRTPFEIVTQILHAPENFPNGAILSKLSGKINKIDKAPDGGTRVYVSDVMHYAAPNVKILKHVGDVVSRGTVLSEGLVNPKELVDLTGNVHEARDYVANTLHQVYKDNGVHGHVKVFESMVRAIVNHGEVEDPGDYELNIGQIVNWNKTLPIRTLNVVERKPEDATGFRLYRDYGTLKADTLITDQNVDKLRGIGLVSVYKRPAKIKPMMLSTERQGLHKDFISAMNYKNIKSVISEAASTMTPADTRGDSPILPYAMATIGHHEDGRF